MHNKNTDEIFNQLALYEEKPSSTGQLFVLEVLKVKTNKLERDQ